MGIVDNALIGASGQSGYNLTRSLRFRSSASAYLNRTPASAGNQKTWTYSDWVKRGTLGTTQALLTAGQGAGTLYFYLRFSSSDALDIFTYDSNAGTFIWQLTTTQVFRDPSAWYHIVIATDTTQATSSNRVKIYVNGSQVTAFSTASYPSLNYDTRYNANIAHYISSYIGTNQFFDGYQAEFNSIDGQALTPSSFGETDAITGVWKPKRYAGTYGTNGFYLPFTDNSALTTSSNVGLGKDFSGNGNYWTTNNISITAGVTYDSMTDVPTLTSATAANFCTWNPVAQSTVVNGTVTRSNGNLTSTDGGTTYGLASIGTIASTTGKWYWEVTLTSAGGTYGSIGVVDLNSALGAGTHTGIIYSQSGNKGSGSGVFASAGSTAYGATYTTGDIIGVALDLTAGSITFYKNGTSQGVAYTGISGNYTPAVGDGQNATSYTFNLNCGQRPFSYTPPTGYVALNTYNLPTSTIVKGNTVMDATLYTGTGSALSITNAAPFQPDFVWIKRRDGVANHALFDSVRGVRKVLISNATDAEVTETAGTSLTAFNSNGFSLGTNGGAASVNINGSTFVGWQWQAGQGTTSSNTNGTITSTVSVNASAGFSVVTYTGNGSVASFGHGLGVTPALIIIKNRSTTGNWCVGFNVSGFSWNWNTDYLYLNSTIAKATDGGGTQFWSAPTSTLINIGGGTNTNGSGNSMVAYCWTPIAGYSAFGSYTGNGSSDGPFIYTGLRPKFLLTKRTDTAESWLIHDTTRNPSNVTSLRLRPNSSDAEIDAAYADILSNGFKLRVGSGGSGNDSGGSYIYAAFAENPFKNALAR